MKKILIGSILLVCSPVSFADQLAYITREQAEQTVAYFEYENIKQVVLWCACCENESKVKVFVTEVYMQPTYYKNYFQVYIRGVASDGQKIDLGVDLAYVHIKKKSKWYCLGKQLGFDCDPCTKPFKF